MSHIAPDDMITDAMQLNISIRRPFLGIVRGVVPAGAQWFVPPATGWPPHFGGLKNQRLLIISNGPVNLISRRSFET